MGILGFDSYINQSCPNKHVNKFYIELGKLRVDQADTYYNFSKFQSKKVVQQKIELVWPSEDKPLCLNHLTFTFTILIHKGVEAIVWIRKVLVQIKLCAVQNYLQECNQYS